MCLFCLAVFVILYRCFFMFYQVNKSAYQIGIIGTGKSTLQLARVSHKGRREKSESAVDTGSEDSGARAEKRPQAYSKSLLIRSLRLSAVCWECFSSVGKRPKGDSDAVDTVLNGFAADRSKSALICEKCGIDLAISQEAQKSFYLGRNGWILI